MAEASRACDLQPSEIEVWLDDGRKGVENALKANPQHVREQYEHQFKESAGGLRRNDAGAGRKKKLQSLLGEDEK